MWWKSRGPVFEGYGIASVRLAVGKPWREWGFSLAHSFRRVSRSWLSPLLWVCRDSDPHDGESIWLHKIVSLTLTWKPRGVGRRVLRTSKTFKDVTPCFPYIFQFAPNSCAPTRIMPLAEDFHSRARPSSFSHTSCFYSGSAFGR